MIKTAFKILMGLVILFILAVVILWLSFFIIQPTQEIADLLHQTGTPSLLPTSIDASVAFAHTLRLNHENMYKLIDPDLHPRLEQWAEQHKVIENPVLSRRCETWAIVSSASTNVVIECPTYTFIVENIKSTYENGTWHIYDCGGVKETPYSGPILRFP